MTVSHQVSEKAATILVVEDDERVRSGLARAFESAGHRVLACGDAAEALRELHRVGCDLIVLDVELPGVSGLALCRLLRAQAATRRLRAWLATAPSTSKCSEDRESFLLGDEAHVVEFAAPLRFEGRAIGALVV